MALSHFPIHKKLFLVVVITFVSLFLVIAAYEKFQARPVPTTYAECVQSRGSRIQESHPPVCVTQKGDQFIDLESITKQFEDQQQSESIDEVWDDSLFVQGWYSYTHPVTGFSFSFPKDWVLIDGETTLKVRRGMDVRNFFLQPKDNAVDQSFHKIIFTMFSTIQPNGVATTSAALQMFPDAAKNRPIPANTYVHDLYVSSEGAQLFQAVSKDTSTLVNFYIVDPENEIHKEIIRSISFPR